MYLFCLSAHLGPCACCSFETSFNSHEGKRKVDLSSTKDFGAPCRRPDSKHGSAIEISVVFPRRGRIRMPIGFAHRPCDREADHRKDVDHSEFTMTVTLLKPVSRNGGLDKIRYGERHVPLIASFELLEQSGVESSSKFGCCNNGCRWNSQLHTSHIESQRACLSPEE